MFSRHVLLAGLCFLLLAASVGVQAASEWGPRTLGWSELYLVHGGGTQLFGDRCCKRHTEICLKNPNDDEGDCENNAGNNGCKESELWDVSDTNKLFCRGPLPGHDCKEEWPDEEEHDPHFCQVYRQCEWRSNIGLCVPGTSLSGDKSPIVCKFNCPAPHQH